MKRLFLLALLFVLISVAGTAFGAFLCMMGWDLTVLVAGETMSFFSLDFFWRGVIYSFPLVSLLALLMLIFYQIRHPAKPMPLVIAYGVFGLLLWLVLFPLCAKAELLASRGIVEAEPLTTDLFRQRDGIVYYFSKVNDDGSTLGLSIDLYGKESAAGEVKELSDFYVNSLRVGIPYADPIIEEAVRFPPILQVPLSSYMLLFKKGVSAWDGGFFKWLQYAAFGLAMLSLCSVQFFTAWRLLNVFLVLLSSILLTTLNVLGYSGKLALQILNPVVWKMQAAGITDPIIFCLNILIFIALTIAGFILYRVREAENEAGESIV